MNTLPPQSARLGANHGYLIDGDVARLHAEVEGLAGLPASRTWALQLWACESPHAGGPLSGIKVAETSLAPGVEAGTQSLRLDAEAEASVPGGQRDYAMVLVLASGSDGRCNQVHDFANYPTRQRFVTPHLEGSVSYRIDDDGVELAAESVSSPRDAGNVSGSLSLELWAVAQPYLGGIVEGHLLGRADLGRVAGQSAIGPIAQRVPFTPPPAGQWEIVVMLREWTGAAGFVTRDYARFAAPYLVADAPVVSEAAVDAVPVVAEALAVAEAHDVPEAPAVATPVEAAPVVVAPPAVAPVEAAAPARVADGLTFVNGADMSELAAIKGMSTKLAAEIVKGRPYASLDSLLDVRGMGPKLLARLRPHLTR